MSMVTTIPNAARLALRNSHSGEQFYVPDIIIAMAEHSIILTAAMLDFRHRVAFLTPTNEPDRSAT
jgi:hypothetical protein